MERWVHVVSLCRFACLLIACLPIWVGSLEMWADRRGGAFQRITGEVRDWIYTHGLLSLERSIGYVKGYNEPDIVLFGIGFIALFVRRPLGDLLAWIAQIPLGWLLAKRFQITITPKRLVVHRWWWNLKLSRESGAEVTMRCVRAEEYFSPYSQTELSARGFLAGRLDQPPAVVEIVKGMRRHKLLMPRHEDRAEAIVARCNEALSTTDALTGLLQARGSR